MKSVSLIKKQALDLKPGATVYILAHMMLALCTAVTLLRPFLVA